MNKKILSLALALSFVSNSFAAATEPTSRRGTKDVIAAAALGALGCATSAYFSTHKFTKAFDETVQDHPFSSIISSALASMIGHRFYEAAQQWRTTPVNKDNPVVRAAYEAADKEFPMTNHKRAAIHGALVGPITTLVTAAAAHLGMKSSKETLAILGFCGAVFFAEYELTTQARSAQKTHAIIEHLVAYFAEHQDELNSSQMVVFAPLITEYHEKKSLHIINPHDMLAQLQAVL